MSAAHARPTRGRARAFLAGGLVLGVGAAVTLAAWTDDVKVGGDFATGEWNVQGNVSSPFDAGEAAWQEYDTTAGGLTFAVNPSNLTPGDTVYAPVALRVDPDKNSDDAEVVLQGASTTGDAALLAGLRYEARTGVPADQCNAAGFSSGTPLVPANTELSTGSGTTTFTLSDDSTPEFVCFAVTLQPSATDTQGLSAAAEWTFSAASTA